jgi:hypothetical protein
MAEYKLLLNGIAAFVVEITARPLAATKREHGVPPLTG